MSIDKKAEAVIARAGGARELAEALGLSVQAVHAWKSRGVPATQVMKVSEFTGVPPHDIRPDVFGKP